METREVKAADVTNEMMFVGKTYLGRAHRENCVLVISVCHVSDMIQITFLCGSIVRVWYFVLEETFFRSCKQVFSK